MTDAPDRHRARLTAFLAGPIARATLLSLAIRLGGIALGMAQAVLTARVLGPEGYGAVAYVFSLSMVFAALALFGTEPLAVREVARLRALGETHALRGLLLSIRRLVLGTALAGAVAAALLLPRLTGGDPAFQAVILFPVLLFPLLAFILQSQGILRGFGQVAMAQVPFQILRPAITVTVLALAWALGLGLGTRGYLIALLGATTAALALTLATLARQRAAAALPAPASQPPSLPAAGVRQVVVQAAPFFSVSVLALLIGEVNTLMLAWWSDAEQTGLFQPIARIAPLMMLGVQAAAIAYAPRVSALWSTGETALLTRITRTFTLTTTAFALLVAFLVLVLGEWILGLFGKDFTAGTAALWWIAGAQVFNAACGPVGILLTMTNRPSLAIWPQAAGLAATLALGYLLIPVNGALGAAIAMSGGTVVWNLGMWIAVRRSMGIDPGLPASVFGAKRSWT